MQASVRATRAAWNRPNRGQATQPGRLAWQLAGPTAQAGDPFVDQARTANLAA